MSSISFSGSGGSVAVITQLRQALDGDVTALGEVIEHIRSEPEGFVAELRKAAVHRQQRAGESDSTGRTSVSGSFPSRLSEDETVLLQNINEGFPEAEWSKFHDLRARFDAELLTPEEHHELIALSSRIEIAHAKRLALVWELAKLRGSTLERMMEELGMVASRVK